MFSNTKKNTSTKVLSNSSNIIGQGTTLEGNLTTAGNLRVEGKVIGSVHAQAKIVLGDTSLVEGNIIAQNAEVGGEVQGTIQIKELLVLKATAVIHGDIVTSKLVFEEGAKFNGKCSMGNSVKGAQKNESPHASHLQNGNAAESASQQVSSSPKGEKAIR